MDYSRAGSRRQAAQMYPANIRANTNFVARKIGNQTERADEVMGFASSTDVMLRSSHLRVSKLIQQIHVLPTDQVPPVALLGQRPAAFPKATRCDWIS